MWYLRASAEPAEQCAHTCILMQADEERLQVVYTQQACSSRTCLAVAGGTGWHARQTSTISDGAYYHGDYVMPESDASSIQSDASSIRALDTDNCTALSSAARPDPAPGVAETCALLARSTFNMHDECVVICV